MPENADALKVWAYCRDQYIMGFGGPVAIRLSAIECAIRLVSPEDPQTTLFMVVALGRAMIADLNETVKAEQNKTS